MRDPGFQNDPDAVRRPRSADVCFFSRWEIRETV